jgi:rhamnosyltransferase
MIDALPRGIAGVVVLYHPDERVPENIRSYLPSLDLLTVVDNSPVPSAALRASLEATGKVVYLWTGENRGVATALNLGAGQALDRGHRWLLTMDQDSRFEPGALEVLIAAAETEAAGTRLGIASPWHVLAGDHGKPRTDTVYVHDVLTSGNLLNLEAYRNAGPFLDKLFIDFVDFEYCERLRKADYRVCIVHAARLIHSLGKRRPVRILGLTLHPSYNHPLRNYYMMRNRLYIWTRYPAFFFRTLHSTVITLVRLFALEEGRLGKLGYLLRGAFDFFRNRYGAYRPLRSEKAGVES